jgi:hypothetical protein
MAISGPRSGPLVCHVPDPCQVSTYSRTVRLLGQWEAFAAGLLSLLCAVQSPASDPA